MVLAMVLALVIGQGADASVVRELEQIEQRLAASWQAGDCAAWGALLAPGWQPDCSPGRRDPGGQPVNDVNRGKPARSDCRQGATG